MASKQSIRGTLPLLAVMAATMVIAFAVQGRLQGSTLAVRVPVLLLVVLVVAPPVGWVASRLWPGEPPRLNVTPGRTFAMLVSGLAIVVAITAVSHDWWLAIEMLGAVSALVVLIAYQVLIKRASVSGAPPGAL